MAGKGSAPGERRGGRKKGTPNKVNADLKAMILGALDKSGGEDYLQKQAEDNPNAFLTLVGKVLPMTIAGDKDAPLISHIEMVIIDAQDKSPS